MSDSWIAHDGAHRIKQASGYHLTPYLQLLRRILRRQSTRAFLASVDIVAIVGETQFKEFKQLKGDGRSHKNA
ncbi:hypothetical protein [Microcoleus sp.]|uniref:hypothetical protein n=1 Tax=Microcoleus sp. TaxID=44472 RepID=UPI00403E37AC